MKTSIRTSLWLGTGLAFTFLASNALSQMEKNSVTASPALYAEQRRERDVSPPATSAPPGPAPSSPLGEDPSATPSESGLGPLQQTLLSSRTLVGVAVNNTQGEKMGTIREIMIDPRNGQVIYAVVDSSGSFGIGKQKSFAVPWKGLQVNLDQTDIVVQLDQGQFPTSPSVALTKQ